MPELRPARPLLTPLMLVTLVMMLLLIASAVATFAAPAPAYAQSKEETRASDLDRQVREIALDLRCPVCQNISVADSASQLATQMRSVIRQKLQAGEPRESIIQYFVERYGEEVRLDPPREGFTLLVWIGAAAGVAGGAFVLISRLRRALPASKGQVAAVGTSLPEAERDRYEMMLDAELSRYKGLDP